MKTKAWKPWQRGLSMLLVLLTVFNLCWEGIVCAMAQPAGDIGLPAVGISFAPEKIEGTQGNQVAQDTYLLGLGAQMGIAVTMTPRFTEGYAEGGYIDFVLPYIYEEDGVIKVTSDGVKPAGIPDDQLMGVEAVVEGTEGWNWIVDKGYGEAGADGYSRGMIRIKAAPGTKLNPEPITFSLTLRFFGNVPENIAASVFLGGGYESYHKDGMSTSEGFAVKPGDGPEEDITALHIVNSNLQWDAEISQVGESVMWDKYNYLTYAVKIKNTTTEDTTSMIDDFEINLKVPSYVADADVGGVLEADMMQWLAVDGGAPQKNDDISDNMRAKDFIGVPNQGGVLVYDVTDIPQEERKFRPSQ